MSQLEQQVLALQQEKHSLISQLDPHDSTDWRDDEGPHPKRARVSPRVNLVTVQDADPDEKDYVSRLQDRIIELERWTEDLNGSLHDAFDSEAHLKSQLQAHVLRADYQARQLNDTVHAFAVERATLQRELEVLNQRADLAVKMEAEDHSRQLSTESLEGDLRAREAALKDMRAENARLVMMLEGSEVTLELQRRENEKLRDRLIPLSSPSDSDIDEQKSTKLHAAEEDVRQLREQLEDQRLDWEQRIVVVEQEKQRLTDRIGAENARLKEMVESFGAKVDSLEGLIQVRNDDNDRLNKEAGILKDQLKVLEDGGMDVDSDLSSVHGQLEEKLRATDNENQALHRQLQKQDAEAKLQEEHWREKVEVAEQERQRMSERVSAQVSAWEKVSAFLESKGIPIDWD